MKKIIALLILLCAVAFAQQKGTLTDSRDGRKYKTVKIGKQTWMAENLNNEPVGRQCYNNNPANCNKYGGLYTYSDAIRACPKGWHLPSSMEWDALIKAVGGKKGLVNASIGDLLTAVDGNKEVAGKVLKAKSGWDRGGNGTDNFGFSALPGGVIYADRRFGNVGEYGYWWSSSASLNGGACAQRIFYDGENIDWCLNWDRQSFLSVRCVRDPSEAEKAEEEKARKASEEEFAKRKAEEEKANLEKAVAEAEAKAEKEAEAKAKAAAEAKIKREAMLKNNGGTLTDSRDKKTYKTIKIGKQTWMAENLNYAAKGSRCYGENATNFKLASKEAQANCEKYGRLYVWKTANEACPKGWHLPSGEEWVMLWDFIGKSNYKILATKLKAESGWSNNGNGTDEFGFSALPSGQGDSVDGEFHNAGIEGWYWTSTQRNYKEGNSVSVIESVDGGGVLKTFEFSVRCVQD